MNCLSENLRYLIWAVKRPSSKSNIDYAELLDGFAEQSAINPERFRSILGEKVVATKEEVQSIKSVFIKYDGEHVPYMDDEYLYHEAIEEHKADLISENIAYLIHSIAWGDNQNFIETLQIQASTLTRWKNGTMNPSKHFQKEICKYFGIRDVDDLKTAFLFLGLSPVSTVQKKLQCKRMIDSITREEFEEIYPSLLKLLR